MKNKFSIFNFKFFNYFKQLFTNENPDNKSDTAKRKVVVETNLRWQDDGGPVVDTRPIDQTAKDSSSQPSDPPKNDSL